MLIQTDGNDGNFHIDSITGNLYAVHPLDYESTRSYNLEVEVKDLSPTAPRTATTTVTVNLKNVNEFYPVSLKITGGIGYVGHLKNKQFMISPDGVSSFMCLGHEILLLQILVSSESLPYCVCKITIQMVN